jgi:hypothetical protein
MDIIKRKEALTKGLKRYYTGKPCKHGHLSERFVSNKGCLSCLQYHTKKYRNCIDNKAKIKATRQQWDEANKDHLKTWKKEYKIKNAESIKEYDIQYQINNRERINENSRRRQTLEVNKIKKKAVDKQYRLDNKAKLAKDAILYKVKRYQATPRWYEPGLIKQIYFKRDELSQLWGITLHVDHIVPLQGENVCGLHCWDNLQLLEASINLSKNNKFNDD